MLYKWQIVLYDIDMKRFNYTADGEYSKRGYLFNDFKVFNIKDKCNKKFEFHYHEFNKIILFKSGNVKYNIEGREYPLSANDILLVKRGNIHRPVIDENVTYNRIVIWIDNNFLDSIRLSECFKIADKKDIKIIKSANQKIFNLAEEIAQSNVNDFAYNQYNKAILIQLLILITRSIKQDNIEFANYKSDRQIDEIIKYINCNLDKKLCVDTIADAFFISRYRLMHKFKEYTGKTIYAYIQSKRLLNAIRCIENGATAKEACYHSGFNDYSVFLKAFKKEFGTTPTKYKDQQ